MIADIAENFFFEQFAGEHVAVGIHGTAQRSGIAGNDVAALFGHLGDELRADDALGVDEIAERQFVIAGELARTVVVFQPIVEFAVIVHVELIGFGVNRRGVLGTRVLGTAAEEKRKDCIDADVGLEVVVNLIQFFVIVGADGDLDAS